MNSVAIGVVAVREGEPIACHPSPVHPLERNWLFYQHLRGDDGFRDEDAGDLVEVVESGAVKQEMIMRVTSLGDHRLWSGFKKIEMKVEPKMLIIRVSVRRLLSVNEPEPYHRKRHAGKIE